MADEQKHTIQMVGTGTIVFGPREVVHPNSTLAKLQTEHMAKVMHETFEKRMAEVIAKEPTRPQSDTD